jgi:LysM repeat protein
MPLILIPVAPRVADASTALAQAQRLLDVPLPITAYDAVTDESFSFTADPGVIAGWLSVQSTDSGPVIIVDDTKVVGYLNEIGATLGEGRSIDPMRNPSVIQRALEDGQPAWLVISHPPTAYTVQSGDTLTGIAWEVGIPYWRILQVNPAINPESLDAGQILVIPSKDDLMPLPVIPGKRIVLSISEQMMWAYSNGVQVYEFIISTGMDKSPTQPGVFQVQTHELSAYASLWDLTMPHFMGIYQSWPGFWNGFHGLPTLSGGRLLWREVLGQPASYGCIILDLDEAETLYNWADDGVVVEIRR